MATNVKDRGASGSGNAEPLDPVAVTNAVTAACDLADIFDEAWRNACYALDNKVAMWTQAECDLLTLLLKGARLLSRLAGEDALDIDQKDLPHC
jgi:hypothetical protein